MPTEKRRRDFLPELNYFRRGGSPARISSELGRAISEIKADMVRRFSGGVKGNTGIECPSFAHLVKPTEGSMKMAAKDYALWWHVFCHCSNDCVTGVIVHRFSETRVRWRRMGE